jgi:hypothetical protein
LPAAAPKRLIVVHLPQGTVLSDHVPTGSETDFTLPFILEPLAAFQDRIITIAGLDNLMPTYNEVGNAHQNANFTLYSGRPFYVQDSDLLSPGGETVEHTLARRISATTPYLRLDFAIGGGETSDGIYNPTEGAYFWAGPNDPVSFFNDPLMTLVRLFGDGSVSPADAWAQRARRAAVLGGVLQSFKTLRRGLGGEDRARLDAHEEKLLELEKRVVNGTGECRAPSLSLPSGYRFGQDDDVSAPLMIELLVTAMSCDLTRVSTLHFANGHDPTFPWLTSENGGKAHRRHQPVRQLARRRARRLPAGHGARLSLVPRAARHLDPAPPRHPRRRRRQHARHHLRARHERVLQRAPLEQRPAGPARGQRRPGDDGALPQTT